MTYATHYVLFMLPLYVIFQSGLFCVLTGDYFTARNQEQQQQFNH